MNQFKIIYRKITDVYVNKVQHGHIMVRERSSGNIFLFIVYGLMRVCGELDGDADGISASPGQLRLRTPAGIHR